MITFAMGEVHEGNATVKLGELDHDARAERDADGNIGVTLDATEPDEGDPVHLTLHDEGDASYRGVIVLKEAKFTFKVR